MVYREYFTQEICLIAQRLPKKGSAKCESTNIGEERKGQERSATLTAVGSLHINSELLYAGRNRKVQRHNMIVDGKVLRS